jgi:hypothetical protein
LASDERFPDPRLCGRTDGAGWLRLGWPHRDNPRSSHKALILFGTPYGRPGADGRTGTLRGGHINLGARCR